MKQLGFGIIGCGSVASVHARSILTVEACKLIGVVDRSEAVAKAFAKEHGAHVYESVEDLLSDDAIDVVCICTPSGLHFAQASAALKRGKHVILEKPMALCAEDSLELCRLADSSSAILSVISQHRFRPDVRALKDMIGEGALGKILFCDLSMKYWRDASYYQAGSWRGTFAMDGGGALMNQGIHGIDLIQYLLGEATLLRGRAVTMVHDIEVEDTAAALLEFPSGALGVVQAATSTYPGFSRRIEINGSRGYAVLVDSVLETLNIDGQERLRREIKPDAGTASDPKKLGIEGHALQYANIVGAIRGTECLHMTPIDGYRAVRLIEQIYESSKQIEEDGL